MEGEPKVDSIEDVEEEIKSLLTRINDLHEKQSIQLNNAVNTESQVGLDMYKNLEAQRVALVEELTSKVQSIIDKK